MVKTILKNSALWLFVLFCSIHFVQAQSPTEEISAGTLNHRYLEHLIKIGIDSVREELGLTPLVNDSILYVAADYHAEFMLETGKFSHFEKDRPITETPQLRAQYFGAVGYLVGENIIKSFLGKRLENKQGRKYTNRTYADMAFDFVDGWVHSPPHYENIKTASYQLTGVAISVDPEKKRVYAVQKFARVPGKYAFEENETLFSWSDYVPPVPITGFDQVPFKEKPKKYDYGLKRPTDSLNSCAACNTGIDLSENAGILVMKGSNYYFNSPDVDLMFDLIKHRKDGLALEFVTYAPLDCGNPEFYTKPSRRNKQSVLSGTVIEPKYRKDLKKGFKKAKYKWYYRNRRKGEAKSFLGKLGKMPKDMEGFVEVNVLVIHKGQVCRTLHYTNVCGENIADSFALDLVAPLVPYPLEEQTGQKVLEFSIPFERGKSTYNYADIAPFLGSLNETTFTLDSANIQAFASVEGTTSINEQLLKGRAQSILAVFDSVKSEGYTANVSADENWDLFATQIANQPKYKEWQELSQQEIKTKLEDPKVVEKLEPLLKVQREAKIALHLHYIVPKEELADYLVQKIADMFIQTENGWYASPDSTDRLKHLQYQIYLLATEGHAGLGHLDALTAFWENMRGLREQQTYIKVALGVYDLNDPSEELLADLAASTDLANSQFITKYNYLQVLMHFLMKKDVLLQPVPKMESLIAELGNEGIDPNLIGIDSAEFSKLGPEAKLGATQYSQKTQMRRLLYISLMNHYRVDGPFRDDALLNTYSKTLASYTKKSNPDLDEIYRVASFLVFHAQNGIAFEMLDYFTAQGVFNDATLGLEAKLAYYHIEEYHDPAFGLFLLELESMMETQNWCNLFVGECNISFQVLDQEMVRKKYCEKCGDYPNAAQRMWQESGTE